MDMARPPFSSAHSWHQKVPEGKRKLGRLRKTWRKTAERELKARGLRTLAEAEAATAAEDISVWKWRARSPILYEEKKILYEEITDK